MGDKKSKLNRNLNIGWIVLMLFFCSFDFYIMLTDFNVWSLIGFVCCLTSAIMNGIDLHRWYQNNEE